MEPTVRNIALGSLLCVLGEGLGLWRWDERQRKYYFTALATGSDINLNSEPMNNSPLRVFFDCIMLTPAVSALINAEGSILRSFHVSNRFK